MGGGGAVRDVQKPAGSPIFSRELGLMEFNTRNDLRACGFPEGSLLCFFGNKLGIFLTLSRVQRAIFPKTKDSSIGAKDKGNLYGL